MRDDDLDAVPPVKVFGQVLRRVNASVLPARAPEGEHEIREAALQVAFDVGIGQATDAFEEDEYLPVLLQEALDCLVETRQLFVGLVASGVVGRTAVEHVASAVAALVLGYALLIGETEDAHAETWLFVRLVPGRSGNSDGQTGTSY